MAAGKKLKRDAELSGKPAVDKQLLDTYKDVEQGFTDQQDRADSILDNWDMYDGKLSDRQFYNGQSQIFLPFVHDAVNARKTRFGNQVFPVSGRYVEVTSGEEEIPQATMALLEGYVRKAKLQTEVVPAMLVNGDVEGQYSVYVSWLKEKKNLTRRRTVANVKIGDAEFPDLGTSDEYDESEHELGRPDVEVLHDQDLLVLPITARSVADAIACGGSVTVRRHWSKGRIRKAIKDGDVTKEGGDTLIRDMQTAQNNTRETTAKIANAAGVRNRGKEACVFETWTEVEVAGERRLCRAYFGGETNILGCKLNPYWCDEVPVISTAVNKLSGMFKGKAPVESVSDLQILANDTINEGADTSHFAAMPIVMTDPEKNPRVASMVLGLAAVWETSPQDTQFAQFPELWQNAMERALACQAQINQTLGVNPAMMPGSTGGNRKMNQAEVANEQQVDLLTTADAVTVLEQGILTPLMQRFAEYDHQFRDEATTIRVYGEVGVRAKMERVEPIQLDNRWEFRWYGVEASQNAAAMQQQIAGVNVVKGIPPAMYADYELDLSPMIVQMMENLFGPRLAPLIFKRKQVISMDPFVENDMLQNGFKVDVNEADNDQEHLAVHMGLLEAHDDGVDPHGTIRDHIAAHQAQMQAKAQQQQLARPAGVPGTPGGAGPGVAGTPAPGAMPEGPRMMKGPPGMIHPDSMGAADPSQMPRQ